MQFTPPRPKTYPVKCEHVDILVVRGSSHVPFCPRQGRRAYVPQELSESVRGRPALLFSTIRDNGPDESRRWSVRIRARRSLGRLHGSWLHSDRLAGMPSAASVVVVNFRLYYLLPALRSPLPVRRVAVLCCAIVIVLLATGIVSVVRDSQ